MNTDQAVSMLTTAPNCCKTNNIRSDQIQRSAPVHLVSTLPGPRASRDNQGSHKDKPGILSDSALAQHPGCTKQGIGSCSVAVAMMPWHTTHGACRMLYKQQCCSSCAITGWTPRAHRRWQRGFRHNTPIGGPTKRLSGQSHTAAM